MSLRPAEPKVSSRFDYVLRVGLEAGANASLPTLDQISINAASDERVSENVMNKNDTMDNDDIGANTSNPGDGDWNRQPGQPRRQSSARAEGQVRGVMNWSRQGHGRWSRARIDPNLQETIDNLTADRERIIQESQEAARRDRQLMDRLAEENAELRAAQEENARIIAGTTEEIDRLQSELADKTRQLEDTDRELERRASIENQIAELAQERNEAFVRFEDNVKNATQEMIDRVQQQLESHLTSLLESKCEADLKQSQETVKLLTDKLATLQSNSGMKTREVVERVVERQALELDEIRKVIALTNPEQFSQELRKAVLIGDVTKVKALLKYGADPYTYTKTKDEYRREPAVFGEPLLPPALICAIGGSELYGAEYIRKGVGPKIPSKVKRVTILKELAKNGADFEKLQAESHYNSISFKDWNWVDLEMLTLAIQLGIIPNGPIVYPFQYSFDKENGKGSIYDFGDYQRIEETEKTITQLSLLMHLFLDFPQNWQTNHRSPSYYLKSQLYSEKIHESMPHNETKRIAFETMIRAGLHDKDIENLLEYVKKHKTTFYFDHYGRYTHLNDNTRKYFLKIQKIGEKHYDYTVPEAPEWLIEDYQFMLDRYRQLKSEAEANS